MMDNLTYDWTVTTLSPLHIGSGERLREGFDFIEHDGALWVASYGEVMRLVLAEAEKEASGKDLQIILKRLGGLTLAELYESGWLRPEHFDLKQGLFRYRLEGATSTKQKQGELLEQVKNIYVQPYLPGSSLKGALRSALLRQLARQDGRKPVINYPNWWTPGRRLPRKEAKVAGQQMERRYFVPAQLKHFQHPPNYDLWKAVQVADSAPPVGEGCLALGRVSVFPVRSKAKGAVEALFLDVEVIPAGITFITSLNVVRWYFEDRRARDLKFSSLPELTRRLGDILNQEARLCINEDFYFLQQFKNHADAGVRSTAAAVMDWYRSVLKDQFDNLEPHEFLLQVGAGTGWLSKTLGKVLQEGLPPAEFRQMVESYNLGNGKWQPGDRVPYTRKLCAVGDQPPASLGWVKVKMESLP